MSPETVARTITAHVIADMNGPLAYWGPTVRPAQVPAKPVRRPAPEPRPAAQSLARLARTVNGRTWTGTSALMSEAIGLPAAA